jgi:hypothetical protein
MIDGSSRLWTPTWLGKSRGQSNFLVKFRELRTDASSVQAAILDGQFLASWTPTQGSIEVTFLSSSLNQSMKTEIRVVLLLSAACTVSELI